MMTPDNIEDIIKFQIIGGQLTGALETPLYSLKEPTPGNPELDNWYYPEPKPTPQQLQTIFDSAPFQAFVANRANAISRYVANNALDKELRRFVRMLLNELNRNRKQWNDFKGAVALATTLADLKTRVAALPSTPQLTIQDIKSAMDIEDA